MRALLQRTTGARVRVDGTVVGEIGTGLVVFLGVGPDDDVATTEALARRITELRLFRDEDGRTNLSLLDVGGAVLLVSQFTLFADTRRGRRPGFTGAAPPELAEARYETMAEAAARMTRFFDRLIADQRGPRDSIALVGHGDPLRAAIAQSLGMPLDFMLRLEIAAASLSVLRIDESGISMELLNDRGHLSGVTAGSASP